MEDHHRSASRINGSYRLRHGGRLLTALLIVLLAAPVGAITPCRIDPVFETDCSNAEAWDHYGVTILARQTAIYATVNQSGATYDAPSRPVASARFSQNEQTVDFVTFRKTSSRTGDYYERSSTGVLTKKGTLNFDQATTVSAFMSYLNAKMGFAPQQRDGWWRDLRDGLAAGASKVCNKATAGTGISFLSFLLAARSGSVNGAITAGLASLLAYENQKTKCAKG